MVTEQTGTPSLLIKLFSGGSLVCHFRGGGNLALHITVSGLVPPGAPLCVLRVHSFDSMRTLKRKRC